MKKNGFTLVELLAVLVILILLITFAVPGIMKIIRDVNNDSFCTKIGNIEKVAIMYGDDMYNDQLSIEETVLDTIKLTNLIDYGYLKKDVDSCSLAEKNCILDPRDKSFLDNNEIIIYTKNNRIYAKFVLDDNDKNNEVCGKDYDYDDNNHGSIVSDNYFLSIGAKIDGNDIYENLPFYFDLTVNGLKVVDSNNSYSGSFYSESYYILDNIKVKDGYRCDIDNDELIADYLKKDMEVIINCYTEVESNPGYIEPSNNKVLVHFNSGGGSLSYYDREYEKNSKYGNLPTASRDGYDFVGWYLDLNDNNSLVNVNSIVNYSENFTLYAKWKVSESSKIIVSFNTNGGIVSQTSKEVVYSSLYGDLPVATKDGYDFVGWIDENGNSITSNSIVNIRTNHTLNASWKVKKITVTVDTNSVKILNKSVYDIEVDYGTKLIDIPLATYKILFKVYTAEWWTINGELAPTDYIITEPVTIKAKWKE